MLDRILEVGVNEHGLMYDAVNPQTGEVTRNVIGDNWGYNYNGFYTVYQLDGVDRYRRATQHALANLKPHYWKFAWQGKLIFDQPRHKTVMQMPMDYPRINQFPEWFTVEANDRLVVTAADRHQTHTGEELMKGLPVSLEAGRTVRLSVGEAE